MANTLHRADHKTDVRDPRRWGIGRSVAPRVTTGEAPPRSEHVASTAKASRTVLLGAGLFLAAVTVGALAMHWATTYQGHQARFTPASIALLVGWVAAFGLPEVAEVIARHRAAKRATRAEAHDQRGT